MSFRGRMDMHEAFRQAVQMCLPQAKVVVDKFHLIRHINGALDKMRTRLQGGNRRGKRRDLFKSQYTLLKGAERLVDWERARLNELLLTLNNWRQEILNYFDYPITNGFVEGKNNRIKTIKRMAYPSIEGPEHG